MGFKTDRVLEYASSGTGETTPILLGHYRLPLRCQTIMIVNLPISGSSTSNLIIEILLSASKRRPAVSRAFPIEALVLLSRTRSSNLHRKGLRMYSAPIGAGFFFFCSGREPNRNDLRGCRA